MTKEKPRKLNQLQRLLPEGLVVDAAWLEKHGYSDSLRPQYVEQGWLEQLAHGVYRRPGAPLKWEAVIISLQNLMGLPVIVGGRTALEMQGFSHYLAATGMQEVHLYGDKAPPGWLNKLPLDVRFAFHNARRLFREEPIARGLSHLSWDIRTGVDRLGIMTP